MVCPTSSGSFGICYVYEAYVPPIACACFPLIESLLEEDKIYAVELRGCLKI